MTHRWNRLHSLFIAAAIAFACACGAGAADDIGDDSTTGGDGDTGTGDGDGDGDGFGCEMRFSVTPGTPEEGTIVVLDGEIVDSPNPLEEAFEWTVLFANEPVETSPRRDDNRSIEFLADRDGSYTVNLVGSSGVFGCQSFSRVVNVSEPGAVRRSYELRVTPPPGEALRERRTINVPVGSGFDLGVVSLEPGVAVDGTVVGPGGPVAAYVRATPSSGGAAIESFAGADGRFDLGLGAENHDLLVVPAGTELAPVLLRDQSPGDLAGDVEVTAGQTIAGQVRDAGDQPLEGVRVSIGSSGAPSAVGVASAAGEFSVQARVDGPASLVVVEPATGGGRDESALVRLQMPASAGWVPSEVDAVAVSYAPEFARRDHQISLRLPGDLPAAQARVVLRSLAIDGAARVTSGVFEGDASAVARFAGRADASGIVGPVALPDGVYELVALPPAGSSAAPLVAMVDLSDGAPTPGDLALPTGYRLSGAITGTSRTVSITARPAGDLADAGLVATATSSEGTYTLALAPGIEYVVDVVAPPSSGRASARFTVVAGDDGAEGERPVDLPAASQIRGSVELPGTGGIRGAHVALYCVIDCIDDDDRPIAEAVTGAGGRFALIVPN